MSSTQKPRANIALLIDADNAPASKIKDIIAEITKHGTANVRRAYGNWKNLQSWEACLQDYAIRPMQQFAYVRGKNATDSAMIIDAMDLLYTTQLDAFALVSSDSDFTPLVMRILANGLSVYGFGERKTPSPFVNACSTFFYIETLNELSTQSSQKTNKTAAIARKTGKDLKQDTKLINLLRNAVSSIADDEGWAKLSPIGKLIKTQASFEPRNYGYAKLSSLFEAIDLFEVKRDKKSIYVRRVS